MLKLKNIVTALSFFALGFVVANIINPTQSIKPTQNTKIVTHRKSNTVIDSAHFEQTITQNTEDLISNIEKLHSPSKERTITLLESQESIEELINTLSEDEISQYLKKYLDERSLGEINNKKLFAKRLLDEYLNSETHAEKLNADLLFSLDSRFPNNDVINFSIKKHSNIYAHLDLTNAIPLVSKLFIKWEQLSDNKVLLFEEKRINSASEKNWVSLSPKKGWQTGYYRVTCYVFESELRVLEQKDYYIENIK